MGHGESYGYDSLIWVDDVFVIDFDQPEDNPFGFFYQLIEQAKSKDKTVRFSKVKLNYYGIQDLRDFTFFRGSIVLGGRAVLFYYKNTPYYAIHEYAQLLALENHQCDATNEDTAVYMNAFGGDEDAQVRSLLLIMPKGILVNAEFQNTIPQFDQRLKMSLREHVNTVTMGKKSVTQHFFPGFYQMMVVGTQEKLVNKAKKAVDSLESAFEGMTI